MSSAYRIRPFLKRLPAFAPRPEIGVGQRGQVAMDWIGDRPDETLTVELWPDGKIVYSAIFGAEIIHGTEAYGEAVPLLVEAVLARLYDPKMHD